MNNYMETKRDGKREEYTKEYQKPQILLQNVDEVLRNIEIFDHVSSAEELEKVMPELLKSLGHYSVSDRAYIFSWTSAGRDSFCMTHEWCAKGVRHTIDEMQNVRPWDIPNWMPHLMRGEPIVSEDWNREKESCSAEYVLFTGQNIRSIMVIPIFSNNKLNGFIGFDNPEESKSELSLRLLKTVGSYIGGLKENFFMMEELEKKQQVLEKALEDAQRANMAKTDFLRRMSHDIRTPLNGILGMIAIADRYPNDLKKLSICRKKVKEAVGFLAELVNSILDMNKLESGAVTLEHTSFNLMELLMEVNNIAEMNGVMQDLFISFHHEQVEHIHLKGSPVHLKQVLQNVAGNAVKYNKTGGSIRFSTNEIACEDKKAVFRFVCSDTGRGMSKAFIERAFEPFAQEHEDARTAYMGTGLGLPITKELVELMGGRIEIESEPNKGTTVTMTIPFEIDTDYKKQKKTKEIATDMDLTGLKVLLTEDNELNLEIAEFILEEAGMEVVTAKNGKEAVEIFCTSPEGTFDVILMDVMMPVMNGLTATRIIRSSGRGDAATIPIIAMTANAFAEDKEESRKAGMNAHLSKPLNEKKMMAVIRRLVQDGRANGK